MTSDLIKYLNTQKLKFKDNCTKPDIFHCDFTYKTIECIFDSFERIAEEIEKLKSREK